MQRNLLIGVLIGVLVVGILAVAIYPAFLSAPPEYDAFLSDVTYNTSSDLKTFNSWDDVQLFLSSALTTPSRAVMYDMAKSGIGGINPMPTGAAPSQVTSAEASASTSTSATVDYSTTNVQVQGVDEADMFKTDGTYIYTLTDGKIAIVRAYPAENASLVSMINETVGVSEYRSVGAYTDFFVNGDKLVAFGNKGFQWQPLLEPLVKKFNQTYSANNGGEVSGISSTVPGAIAPAIALIAPGRMPPYYGSSSYASFLKVFDISNRSNPILVKEITYDGNYVASRMIGNNVYLIFQEQASPIMPMPVYAVDKKLRTIQPTEINYIDSPFESYSFTTVLGVDLSDLNKNESRKVLLMGSGQDVYVSPENAYITYSRDGSYAPRWPAYLVVLNSSFSKEYWDRIALVDALNLSQWRGDNLKVQVAEDFLDTLPYDQRNNLYNSIYNLISQMQQQAETTVIHKVLLGSEIQYLGKGEVPGHILNQFSMDEYNGNFRIATTIGEVTREGSNSTSNVYVLNSTLGVIGRLERLAPGEKIYSARFMGERAYLVTFRKVDPLFVISLKEPTNPQVLGKLKIPGYSDYLHPHDENHLIGIGKNAVPSEEGDFAWYQGVKLSLFDVTNVSAPVELANYTIGDRGTESLALNDHKAFLFDKTRGLLVVPITLAEIDKNKYPQGVELNQYGDYTFQGAYVFNVSLTSGFTLRGRISHANQKELDNSGEFYYGGFTNVKRSAYIGDMLYTVSDTYVKANSLSNLASIASVALPLAPQVYPIMIE